MFGSCFRTLAVILVSIFFLFFFLRHSFDYSGAATVIALHVFVSLHATGREAGHNYN